VRLRNQARVFDIQADKNEGDTEKAEGAIEAHDLRTRRAGSMTFIDFHHVVAGRTTVSKAHEICDRLERAIKQTVGEALITIHVEPDNKAKHSDVRRKGRTVSCAGQFPDTGYVPTEADAAARFQ
jgi:divalent metal cation (Fe/Co/Zn/Cd) transporter